MIDISSVGHYVPYRLVVLLIKERRDAGMACRWNIGVYFTKRDQLKSTLLSRVTLKGYRYKCPSDLRSPRWLASNSLCFDARLCEFLIQRWKISGYSQILVKSVCESRWNWSLLIFQRQCYIVFQFSKILIRVVLVRNHRIYKIEIHYGCTD